MGLDYVELVERTAFDYGMWVSLRELVRARGIDIVHAHDYKTNLLALMLARTEGVVPMTTAHGWTGHSWRERRLYYPMDKRMLRYFPFVVAVSGQIKSDLIRAGVDGRTHLGGVERHRPVGVPPRSLAGGRRASAGTECGQTTS